MKIQIRKLIKNKLLKFPNIKKTTIQNTEIPRAIPFTPSEKFKILKKI
jgi:hypothetical protein